MMSENEAGWDRAARLALAVTVGTLALMGIGGTLLTGVFWLLAVVMLGTAAVGFCPLYAVLGVSTCPTRR